MKITQKEYKQLHKDMGNYIEELKKKGHLSIDKALIDYIASYTFNNKEKDLELFKLFLECRFNPMGVYAYCRYKSYNLSIEKLEKMMKIINQNP